MILAADHNTPQGDLLLEVAFETERLVARDEHLLIHRTMRLVAGRAAFPQGFMFEDERAELGGMAFAARFILGHQRRPAAFDRISPVWIMAVAATDFSFNDWVMMGKTKLTLFVEVALETGLRRFVRVHDRAARAPGLIVNASRPVA